VRKAVLQPRGSRLVALCINRSPGEGGTGWVDGQRDRRGPGPSIDWSGTNARVPSPFSGGRRTGRGDGIGPLHLVPVPFYPSFSPLSRGETCASTFCRDVNGAANSSCSRRGVDPHNRLFAHRGPNRKKDDRGLRSPLARRASRMGTIRMGGRSAAIGSRGYRPLPPAACAPGPGWPCRG
jgi:hypothetical protein